jgi:hypothetical protein
MMIEFFFGKYYESNESIESIHYVSAIRRNHHRRFIIFLRMFRRFSVIAHQERSA